MKVELQRHGSVLVVVPHDSLTEVTCPELQSVLTGEAAQAGSRVVLDMTSVPFVDSAGIECLLAFAGDVKAGPLRPRIVGLVDTVREVMDLTDTLKRFFVFDSVEAAVRSFV